jgi:hypothetical protein
MAKSNSIMKQLEDIVSFLPNTTGTFLVQAEHYGNFPAVETLTKEELVQLAQELIDLTNKN